MNKISVVTPCYNEEENVEELYMKVRAIFRELKGYNYEHIFIDNASQDKTVLILKGLAREDKNLKIIVNIKNFGHIRSPYYGLLQAKGDAVIFMAADFQDPPELIKAFLSKWEEGYKIVIGVKNKSEENPVMFGIRRLYYFLIKKFSDGVTQIENFTGFGLYDRTFIDILKNLNEPYPYLRGLVADFGMEQAEVKFVQPKRKKGVSQNNFYTLFDVAMLGFVSYSMVPLRIATFFGFFASAISFLMAIIYFIYKIIFWSRFQLGVAPIIIGFFFLFSIQLFFIGIIGEYVGAVFTQVKGRPLVIEKERINFN
ncbi:MAG: glycosyltransferase family 2 protein [Candidatus Omnitrophica bacterium]|nr:glycosyltransferase family 2 protein [Candidatus Omnitrophota bacterium]